MTGQRSGRAPRRGDLRSVESAWDLAASPYDTFCSTSINLPNVTTFQLFRHSFYDFVTAALVWLVHSFFRMAFAVRLDTP